MPASSAQPKYSDVIEFLIDQHDEIKTLFAQTLAESDKKERAMLFLTLRRLLAVHETAEEIVVHPHARDAITDGSQVVDARLAEEHEAKTLLSKIEHMDVDSREFTDALTELQSAVLMHAKHEELDEFPWLRAELTDEDLRRMAATVQAAQAIAPTRPHAGVESATLNLAAGPFVAMLDRARDILKAAAI